MKKKLRIYLPFASNELKRQMAYKGAFYLFLLSAPLALLSVIFCGWQFIKARRRTR